MQIVVEPYNGTPLSNKNESTTDKCNNLEESQKPFCRMKETSLEKIKHHAIPWKYHSFIVTKNRSEVAKSYSWEEGVTKMRQHKGGFWYDEIVLYPDYGHGYVNLYMN